MYYSTWIAGIKHSSSGKGDPFHQNVGIFVLVFLLTTLLSSYVVGSSPVAGDSTLSTYLKDYNLLRYEDPDSALMILRKAQRDNSIDRDIESTLELNVIFSECFLGRQNFDSSKYYAHKVIDNSINDSTGLQFRILTVLGTIEYYNGDYVASIGHHLDALRLADKLDESILKARAYNNIGIAFIKIEDWVQAEENMLKALDLCKELDLEAGLSYTLGNLGIIYRNLGFPEKAMDMYIQSIDVNKKRNDFHSLARNYNNVARIYEENQDYENARNYYVQGLNIAIEKELHYGLALAYHNIGNVDIELGNFKSALSNLSKATAFSKEAKAKDIQVDIVKAYSKLYERRGDYKNALVRHKRFQVLKDSIEGLKNIEIINDLKAKYDSERKEKENLALLNLNIENESEITNQRNRVKFLIIFFSFFTVLIFGGAMVYMQFVGSKKKSELLRASNDSQLQERTRIAQDLHDGLGGSMALIKNKLILLCKDFDKERKNEFQSIIEDVTKAGGELRLISHDLMPPELEKFGLVSAIEACIENLFTKDLKINLYVTNYRKEMDLQSELQLFRILKELMQNVVKHAHANMLNIHLTGHESFVNLLIEDDGIGIVDYQSNAKGIGLRNVKSRVSLLNGTMNIDSQRNMGTTINISIPKT